MRFKKEKEKKKRKKKKKKREHILTTLLRWRTVENQEYLCFRTVFSIISFMDWDINAYTYGTIPLKAWEADPRCNEKFVGLLLIAFI